jgi:hypothetical protein
MFNWVYREYKENGITKYGEEQQDGGGIISSLSPRNEPTHPLPNFILKRVGPCIVLT